jgi:uncharacterized protein YndB with AHSA1/START domain
MNERIASPPASTVVQIRRTLAAPREDVFRAWTDAQLLARWFRPSGTRTDGAETDPRPGGRWRIAMTALGRPFYAFGEYIEITPPERLVFSLGWERVPFVRLTDSVVTVEFADRGDQTELVLTHERLRNRALRAWHARGWRECLDELRRFIGSPGSA